MRGIREHMRGVGIVNNSIETAQANRRESKQGRSIHILRSDRFTFVEMYTNYFFPF